MKIIPLPKNENAELAAKIGIDDNKISSLFCAFEKYLDFNNLDKEISITEISSDAFKNVVGVENIILPKSTETIKEFAFKNCADLKTVVIDADNGDLLIQSNSFDDCKNLDSVCITCNKLTIEKDAFIGCSKIRAVVLICSDLALRKDSFLESTETTIYGNKKIGSSVLKKYCDKKKIKFVEVN